MKDSAGEEDGGTITSLEKKDGILYDVNVYFMIFSNGFEDKGGTDVVATF